MFYSLVAVLFCSEISYGYSLSNDLQYRYMNFTNKIEGFLESEEIDISSQCKDHLLRYLRGLRSGQQWAIRMLDAGAVLPPSGVLEGNLLDLGSFDECLNIQQRSNDSLIFGKYCIGKMSIRSDHLRFPQYSALDPFFSYTVAGTASNVIDIYLAKCFPEACTAAEMENINYDDDYNITFYEELCQTKTTQPTLDDSSIVTITVFGVILGIAIISTVYDVACNYYIKKPAHSLLLAFSFLTNGKRFLNTKSSSEGISCLFGIRSISTICVILVHTFHIRRILPTKNFLNYKTEDKEYMFLHNAFLSVDTFLLISGLLIAYNYMNTTAKGLKFNIIIHYVHRYLRLTPALAVLVLFHITLLRHMGSGPLWPSTIQKNLQEGCEMYWWKTLLYIQNIDSRGKEKCIDVAWYLSVDMQLFILSPFLLISLKRWPKLTISMTGLIVFCSVIACFCIAWFQELNPYMEANKGENLENFVWNYYLQTHTRASPWLIGIVLGYLIFKSKKDKPKFLKSKTAVCILWVASLGIFGTCTFTGHDLIIGEFNQLANSFYIALVRPVWSAAIAWIIYACVNGYGGPVNWFLSLPIFNILSKLSYTLYLVHYPVIFIITAQMRSVPVIDNFQQMHKFWGDFAFSSVVGLILSLTIEYPMIAINKYLFG